MRGRTSMRHVLVVAPQCASMERLTRLEEAAADLFAVLSDVSVGACRPGLPPGSSALVTGDGLTSAEITATVHTAAAYAAEHGAVLVLAFLGHGFVPGQAATLHFMGADSVEDVRHGSVNVSELLTRALDHPGIPGVLGIIDTCHAAGALPAAQDLTAGTRLGQSRLSLLMGSSLSQAAVDLAFSRGLTTLLRRGLLTAGRKLTLADLGHALRRELVGQNITAFDYAGAASEPLWIARNASARMALLGGLTGPLAHEELTESLGRVDPPVPVPTPGASLQSVLQCRKDVLGRAPSEERDRAVRALDGAIIAIHTVTFIRGWIGGKLTTEAIRHALHTMLAADRRVPGASVSITDVGIIDELAFNHPESETDGLRSIARFVALLGQACGMSLDDPALEEWGQRIEAPALVNDARRHAATRTDGQRMSLVVSLHASLAGEWPETLDAWLLMDGALLEHEQFTNESADRRGAEDAVERAVLWADEHARTLKLPLKRLDIAIPSSLLLEWRPEEAGAALLLGVRFDVRLHWSNRLNPDAVLRSIEGTLAERWETISECGDGAPVDWLAHEELADPQTLRSQLRNGRYARGIGLTQHPGTDARLMETLLAYTPVLLWPHTAGGFPKERHGCLEASWWAMPGVLTRAYRNRWRGEEAGDLADLRAVWDDQDWLRFCRHFRSTPPPAPTADEGTA
ncbi:vWA-MoxR associated conflict system protein [Streptomyces pristinaespiralis]|uniref:vWA-MoxR associated conflict system protein n=1 Tax=Streptomyces pristinaespiralis TaxID=38300 RepID=UPI003832712F